MSRRSMSSQSVLFGRRLLALAAVTGALVVVPGCSDPNGASSIYPNAAACIEDKVFTPEFCNANFQAAKAAHDAKAPHYQDKPDCEEDFGKDSCEEVASSDDLQSANNNDQQRPHVVTGGGGGSYAPRMNGYWVGRTMGENGAPSSFSYPVYGDAEAGFHSPLTEQSFESAGRVYTQPNAKVAAEIAPSPRAGFSKGASFAKASASMQSGGFGAVGRGYGGLAIS